MRPIERVALASVLAIVSLLGLSALVLLRGKAETLKESSSDPAIPTQAPAVAVEHREPATEKLIEEVLAEENREDPGAVFLMSRIRETVREGNPAFAGELLRQMKEEYPSSILVYEAEEIVKLSR